MKTTNDTLALTQYSKNVDANFGDSIQMKLEKYSQKLQYETNLTMLSSAQKRRLFSANSSDVSNSDSKLRRSKRQAPSNTSKTGRKNLIAIIN